MADPVTLYMFGEDEPFTTAKLQHNLQALAEGVARLSRQTPGWAPPGNLGAVMRTRGGVFRGDLTVPSAAIVTATGELIDPVNDGDLADPATRGVILRAENVTGASQFGDTAAQLASIGNTLNALLDSLQAAGSMAA
jgi:hypothetical protein